MKYRRHTYLWLVGLLLLLSISNLASDSATASDVQGRPGGAEPGGRR